MHDIRLIREDPQAFDAALARRGVEPVTSAILALDARRRENLTNQQKFEAERNHLSKEYGQLKAKSLGIPTELQGRLSNLRDLIPAAERQAAVYEKEFRAALSCLPNLPAKDDPSKPLAERGAPDGNDENNNAEVSDWGIRRKFIFEPKEHADLGPPLGLDFETGALISGARFTFLRGQMARLQRALGQFMLDRQTGENGYTECAPPLLVRDEAVLGTGQLPKFADDLFQTSIKSVSAEVFIKVVEEIKVERGIDGPGFEVNMNDDDFFERLKNATQSEARRWLIPTAEVSLTNSVREQILAEAALPIRLTALTPCFRSEAGAAGKDTRGYIRQHQFDKVELVTICRPEDSLAEHERMTAAAESILQALALPYRKMLLCAGDMGFTARKTYDLEVWLPGQGAYREISSISNCGDFQARRMDARFRPANGPAGEKAKPEFVHTLNGSGLAVGRTLVAVLENCQQADGSVAVPAVLHPYMGGITRLTATA